MPQLKLPFIAFFIIRSGFWMFLFFFSAYLVQKFHYNRVQTADAYIVLALWTLMILNTIVKWVRKLFSVEQLILITGVVLSISILAISF